ncbi:hypothetical protein CU098_012692 [Rhizopus stolonifer]|uniref:Cyclin N-terminal domain-containing protein n=1 Tax=Rhizopus stolonifer TaxID=4846 RepID=A0A367KN40_RHIST|nr:hypothetical protein CU098_012692 [Rhizopus stolonifer]
MYALSNMLNRDYYHHQRLPSVTAIKRTPVINHYNRHAYVDALVDANAMAIESIWNTTMMNVVPLRNFIQEVLRRSRTTYSTLQTSLFYLFRIRPLIVKDLSQMHTREAHWEDAYVSCGRRMFLASLVIASKFVQDKTYRNSAWAKIAGLPVSEINAAERIFLDRIDYQLYISQPSFEQWYQILHLHIEAKTQDPLDLPDLIHSPLTPSSPDWSPIKPQPLLSLPSSIHSSPMKTPPVKYTQKRKFKEENHFSIGYHISHVRQSSKRTR